MAQAKTKQRKNPYYNEPEKKCTRGNPQYLIPINERPEEEQRKIREKSRQSRIRNNQQRKKMKEELELLLTLTTRNRDLKHEFKKRGLPEPNEQTAILANMIAMASAPNKQAVSAASFVRDTVGESPTQKQLTVQTDFESFIKNIEGDEF